MVSGGFLKRGHVPVATMSPKKRGALEVDKVSNLCNNISSSMLLEVTPMGSLFKIKVILEGWNRSILVVAMVDCGATTLFISEKFVKENKVRTNPLDWKI